MVRKTANGSSSSKDITHILGAFYLPDCCLVPKHYIVRGYVYKIIIFSFVYPSAGDRPRVIFVSNLVKTIKKKKGYNMGYCFVLTKLFPFHSNDCYQVHLTIGFKWGTPEKNLNCKI